jgi:hypothetical protein
MSFRRSTVAALFVLALTVSPVVHAATAPTFNGPFAGTLQFWSTIVASIESVAHELATTFIPHPSQLTDSSNPQASNNLNPPPVTATAFTAAVADAIPNTATSSQPASTATFDQTTQSPFVKSPALSTPTPLPQTIIEQVPEDTATFVTTNQFHALSNRLSKLTGIVGDLASLLPPLSSNAQPTTSSEWIIGDGNPEAIGAGAAIDQLSNVTITNPSITGLSAGDVPNLSGSYLSLAGGTLTGAFADSATASSSFTGALGIATTSPSDVLAVNGPVYLANVTPAATASRLYNSRGSLYWNGSALATGGSGASTTTPNTWTSLQQFSSASSSLLSVYGPTYFGATATSSFGTNGALTLASALGVSSGGTGTTTWQTGSIPFYNGGNFTENNSNLRWDNTNNRLGIGTTTPGSIFSVQGVGNFTTATSTYYSTGGINLGSGCFAVAGNCIGAGALQSQIGQSFTVDASSSAIAAGTVVSLTTKGTVEEGYATIQSPSPTTVLAPFNSSVVTTGQLDASHAIIEYRDNSNGNQETGIDCTTSGTLTCGPAVLTSTSTSNTFNPPIILSSTEFVIEYTDSNNSSIETAVACSTSGTTITCGTPITTSTSTNITYTSADLDSSHFAVEYTDSHNSSKETAVVCSTSGTTITCGTPVTTSASTNTTYKLAILNSTTFAIEYLDSTNSSKQTAVVCSVSGTTVSCGSPAVTSNSSGGIFALADLDSSHFFIEYVDTTNSSDDTSLICSVSGTTITCGTTVVDPNGVGSRTPVLLDLDSTHMAVDFTLVSGVELCSVSGGTTVSCGANNTGLSGTTLVPLDSTHFVVDSGLSVAEATVSGTSIQLSNAINFDPGGTSSIGPLAVDSGDVAGFSYYGGNVGQGLREITLSTSTFGTNWVNPLTVAGFATNAANAGGSVNVIYQGLVSGLSGLSTGSTYFALANGVATLSSVSGKQIGYAVSPTQLFLNSQNSISLSPSTILFADAIFANNFRITEAQSSPQSLLFLDQNGQQIASLDENGNFTIPGHLSSADNFAPQDATTTALSTIAASFEGASQALQSALSALGKTVIRVLGDAVYATTGIFQNIFAQNEHVDTLCIGNTCLTEDQIDAVLQRTGVQASNATSTENTATTTATHAATTTTQTSATPTDASTTDAAATTTDPTANATTTPAAPTTTIDASTTDATQTPATSTAPGVTPPARPTPPSDTTTAPTAIAPTSPDDASTTQATTTQ